MAVEALRCAPRRQSLRVLISTLVWLASFVARPSHAQLSSDFYASSCRNVAGIVRGVVRAGILRDPASPAALLRLFFHDCQVQGCDASILLDSQGGIVSERESATNFGIKRLDFIDNMKTALELACPNTVSCADIVVLAAREAVNAAGGPFIPVDLGRKDSTTASSAAADQQIPSPASDFDSFAGVFQSKGMSLEESVAILGAHTLGVGHCRSIVNRLYPSKEAQMNLALYGLLRLRCPAQYNDQTTLPNDATTLIFDNQYFNDARAGLVLFTLDAEVAKDPRSAPIVQAFSRSQQAFFQSFTSAFQKLSVYNVLTDDLGEVRQNCHFVN